MEIQAGVASFAKIVFLQMAAAAEIRPVLSGAINLHEEQAFTSNPEFDLLVACCAGSLGHDSSDRRHADRIRQILSHPLDGERLTGLRCI